MREMGQEDAIFRNYDLLWNCGKHHAENPSESMHLWLALKRINVFQHGEPRSRIPWGVAEVAQRVVNLGGERPPNSQVVIRLIAWYNWDRIRKGEVQQFMLRSRSG